MNKYEKVNKLQKEYRRGLWSYTDAIRNIKELFCTPFGEITDKYAEWLLFEYHFC